MKVEVESGKFDRVRREWAPRLAPKPVSKHGFQIALVGKLQNEGPLGPQDALHLGERLRCIGHVMQNPNHCHGVEHAVDEGETVRVGCYKGVSGRTRPVWIAPAPVASAKNPVGRFAQSLGSAAVLRPAPAPTSSIRCPLEVAGASAQWPQPGPRTPAHPVPRTMPGSRSPHNRRWADQTLAFRRARTATDCPILETLLFHQRRIVDIPPIEDDWPFEHGFQLVQVQLLNSFHSVTTITPSHPAAIRYGSANISTAGRIGCATSVATGSYACTLAPAASRCSTISIDGASRMSSVLGLNARPNKPMVFPSKPPTISESC